MNRAVRPYLLMLVLGVYISLQHVQQCECERGAFSKAWWRLRNQPVWESVGATFIMSLARNEFDPEWVQQQMNFVPLGMYVFLRWIELLQPREQQYAWQIVSNSEEVTEFMSKFEGVSVLVGEADPLQTLEELKKVFEGLGKGVIERSNNTVSHCTVLLRQAFFDFASRICGCIRNQDGKELQRVLSGIIPLLRECIGKMVRLISSGRGLKFAAAGALLSRWINKLFRLNIAFSRTCPLVPVSLVDDFVVLENGFVPSEAVTLTILNGIPPKWRSDARLVELVPAVGVSMVRKH